MNPLPFTHGGICTVLPPRILRRLHKALERHRHHSITSRIQSNRRSALTIALAACYLAGDTPDTFLKLAVGYNSYASLDKVWTPNQSTVFGRVVCYGITWISGTALLLLTPRKKLAITKLGGRTLAAHFLHVPILNTLGRVA